MLYSDQNKVRRDSAGTIAIKIFLSFLLVFSMIPSGLSLQSFAESSESAVTNSDTENADVSGDSENQTPSDEAGKPESSGDDVVESPDSPESDDSAESSGKTESSEIVEPIQSDINNTPIVQALRRTLYWSPTAEDITSGSTVIAKAGNDDNDGSTADKPVLTWKRLQELFKDDYGAVNIYVLAPIKPGTKNGDDVVVPDDLTLNGAEDGYSRSVTLFPQGSAASSLIELETGKSLHLENIILDITDTMAQQSILVAQANDTDAGGQIEIGVNVNITGRIVMELESTGKSLRMDSGKKYLKNAIKFTGEPFKSGSIDVLLRGLNIDEYMGGLIFATSENTENLKNFISLNVNNTNSGFSLKYTGEVANPDTESAWNTKELQAYKKLVCTSLYVDNVNGSDDNTGYTHYSPLKTIEKAKEVLLTAPWQDGLTNRPISLCNTYSIDGEVTWDFSDVGLPSGITTDVRMCTLNGKDDGHTYYRYMVQVNKDATFTVKNLVLRIVSDAATTYHDPFIIAVLAGGTLNLQSGAILGGSGSGYTYAPGIGVMVSGDSTNTTTFNMESGAYIQNLSEGIRMTGGSSSTKDKTIFNFSGGTISQNSNYTYKLRRYSSSTWGGGGLFASYVTVNMDGDATVENNESFYDQGYSGTFYNSTGCGLWMSGCTFNLEGGSIKNNTPRSVSYRTNSYGNPVGGNWVGAGIYMNSTDFIMTGGEITGNSFVNCWENSASSSIGGGIYYNNSNNGAKFQISGGSIHGNNAFSGAGIYVSAPNSTQDSFFIKGTDDANLDFYSNNSTKWNYSRNTYASIYLNCNGLEIENVKFRNNTKNFNNTGSGVYGGGLYVGKNGNSENLDINKCTFLSNSLTGTSGTNSYGAGLYLNMSSYSTSQSSWYKATVQNCTFSNNTIASTTAGYGGGAFVANSDYSFVNFSNNTFSDNKACYGGGFGTSGGMNTSTGTGSAILRENNVFSGNASTNTSKPGGDHVYSSGGLTLLGASFASTGSDVRPAIYYKSSHDSRRMSVLTSGLTFIGCYAAYLDSITTYMSFLDTDTDAMKPFKINSSALNCVVAKGADNIKIPKADNSAFDTYNIEDITTNDFYLNSVTGATSDEIEIIKYSKNLYIQKKASDATDGVYLDGINGDDNNVGLTTLTAVKTFARAKEILTAKIAEANTSGKIFNPYIIISGTVTLSEDTTISLSADEIGSMSAKAYDAYPTGKTLPAEDKEFFPMIYPEERLTAPMFSITGGNVSFENVYFEGKSKIIHDARLLAVSQTGGTVSIGGNSRIVDFYETPISVSGADSVLDVIDDTFMGFNCNNSYLRTYINVNASTLNVKDNVYLYLSYCRYISSSSGHGNGVNVTNKGTVNITGNVNFDWKNGNSDTSCIQVTDSTLNIGDSINDTEDSHVTFSLYYARGINSASASSDINVKGYTKFEGSNTSYGYGLRLVHVATSNVSIGDNVSISKLNFGFYLYSTSSSSVYTIDFSDNAKISGCQYAINSDRTNSSSSEYKVNLTLNDNSQFIDCYYGISAYGYNSTYRHSSLFDIQLNDSSLISATYWCFYGTAAVGHKIKLSGNSKIVKTSDNTNTCIYMTDSANSSNKNVGSVEVTDNASIESAGNSYAVSISSTLDQAYSASLKLSGNAKVGPVYFNNRYTKGNFDMEVLDSSSIASSVDTKYPVTTNGKLSLDLTATIDGDISLGDIGYIVLNDPNSSGTQADKFRLLLTSSKMGTRVVGPGTNVTNAADYKTTFATDDEFELQEGTGDDANWLILPADGNVYISGVGSDSNTGLNSGVPVKTFARAKEIMKKQKKGANFIIAGNLSPVEYGETTWELDEGGTITNEDGDTWKPTIDVSDSFTDSYVITIKAMTSSQTMKFKNLNFTHPDENGRLNGKYYFYTWGYSTATGNNRAGSKLEFSGCNFDDFKVGSSFRLICSSIHLSVQDSKFTNFNVKETASSSHYLIYSGNNDTSYESLIDNVTFENNHIESSKTGGIGSFIYNSAGKIRLNNVTIKNNEYVSTKTTNYDIYGPFIYTNNYNSGTSETATFKGINVTNNTITKNTNYSVSIYGAAIYCATYTKSFENCIIDNNSSSNVLNYYSIYCSLGTSAKISFNNCQITNNQTGGLYMYSDTEITGGDISNNGNKYNSAYSSCFTNLTPKNNAKISDPFYLTGTITLASLITNPSIKYTVYPSNSSPGRIIVKPDGDNIVNVEAFKNYFDLVKNSSITAELGASVGNIILKKAIYFGGESSNDSNNGLTPESAVQTFAQAQTRAKSYRSDGKYINYYMVGAYNNTLASETWDLDSTRATSDKKFTSEIFRYNGSYVPGQVNKTYSAYTGPLFNKTKANSSITFTNVSIDGRSDGLSVGTMFEIPASTTINIGEGATLYGGSDLAADAETSIANLVGILNVSSNAKLYGANNASLPAIMQNGTLNLSGTPLIKGDVNLPGDGTPANDKFINVEAYTYPFNSNAISVVVQSPYSGRQVLKYSAGHEPEADELAGFALDDNTSASYIIGNNDTDPSVVQLTAKNCVYVDPDNGDDSKNGFSPDNAKKTLQGAWDAMEQRKGDSGRGGGVVYLCSTLNFTNTNVKIENVPASQIASEKSYLTVDNNKALSTDGYVSFRRYVQPTAHASLAGFTKETFTGQILTVFSNATLTLKNQVSFDGHGKEVVGSKEITAPAFTQTSDSPIEINGSATINYCDFTNLNVNGDAGVVVSGSGDVSFIDSTINVDTALQQGEYYGGLNVDSTGNISFNNSKITGSSTYSVMFGDVAAANKFTFSGANYIEKPISFYTKTTPFNLANDDVTNNSEDGVIPFSVEFNDSYSPQTGDKVAVYTAGDAPATAKLIKKKITIDDETRKTFNLVRSTSDTSTMILDYPGAVYILGTNSDDSNDGLTADSSVKTWKRAYEVASENDSGYLMYLNNMELWDTEDSGGVTFDLQGKYYYDSETTTAINLDRELVHSLYVSPSATGNVESSMGFIILRGYNLNLSDITFDGHSEAWKSGYNSSISSNYGIACISSVFEFLDSEHNRQTKIKILDGVQIQNAIIYQHAGLFHNSASFSKGSAVSLDINELSTDNISFATLRPVSFIEEACYYIQGSFDLTIEDPDKLDLDNNQNGELQLYGISDIAGNVTFKKKPNSNQKYKFVFDNEWDDTIIQGKNVERGREFITLDYDNADALSFKENVSVMMSDSFEPGQFNAKQTYNLRPCAKFDDNTKVILADYQNITVTKTWTKPNSYAGDHPDSLQFTIKNGSTSTSKDTAGDLTVDVSVPSSGDATATHGSVVKSTNAKGEDVWTITLKDMPRYEGSGVGTEEISYVVTETQLGGEAVDASKWKSQVNKANNQTFTISNTPQRVIAYDQNGGSGSVKASEILDYGTTISVAAKDASLVRDGYQFVGWNTSADGTGKHYNANATFALNENTTLYAQWAKITVVMSASHPWGASIKARRGDTVTLAYSLELPEAASVNGLSLTIPVDSNIADYASAQFTSSDFNLSTATANTWNVTSKNTTSGEKTFTIKAQVKTDLSVNNADKMTFSGKATMGDMRNSSVDAEMPITDSFKISYNINGGTGTTPSDTKYYAPEFEQTYTTMAATSFTKTGMTFVGWNTSASGEGTFKRQNETVQTTTLTNDVTYYAMWSSATMLTTIKTNKAKAKPNDVVHFTVQLVNPMNVSSMGAGSVVVTSKIPDNMTYADYVSESGVYSNGVVTFTLATSIGNDKRNLQYEARVNTDIVEKKVKSTTAVAKVAYPGEEYYSSTATVSFTDAYQVTYSANSTTGITGDVPTDTNYYSKELGEKATVLGSGNLKKSSHVFVGWNTSADGTGIHYGAGDELELDKNVTLYAQWMTHKITTDIVGAATGVTKARRGNTLKYTFSVTIPEAASINELTYSITNDANLDINASVFASDNFYCDTSSGNYAITAHNSAPGTFTFTLTVPVKTDISVNSASYISLVSSMTMGDTKRAVVDTRTNITKSYKLTYDGNGQTSGSAPTDGTYYAPEYSEVATTLGNIADPSLANDGYAFSGWNTTSAGSGKTFAPGDEVAFENDLATDVTLYAQWAKASVTHTSELGHSKVRRGEKVDYTATIDVPSPTTTLGLSVALPDYLTYCDASANPTSATIAGQEIKWADITAPKGEFTFKFSATLSEDISLNDLKSADITANFTNNKNDFGINHSVDITRSYKATFDVNGGAGTISYSPDVQYLCPEYGDKLTLPTNKNEAGETSVTRLGYTFNGFNADMSGQGTHFDALSTTTLNDDMVMYVEWRANIYTIAFDKNSDEAKGDMPTISAYYDKPVKLPSSTFARNNFGFIGWAKDSTATEPTFVNGATVENLTDVNGGEVTLFAIWSDDFKTIKFDSNGGSAVEDINVATGKVAVKPNDPVKTGYTFAGWASDEELTTDFDWTTEISDDITLYAKWTPITYKLNFVGNGASSGEDKTEVLTYDQDFTLSSDLFANANYEFSEWNTLKSGAGTSYKGSTDAPQQATFKNLANTQDAEVFLYAIWDAGFYTIHFDKNEPSATGEMSDVSVCYDENYKLPLNKFANAGYVFAGWTTNKTSKQALYSDGKSIKSLTESGKEITLYAIWTNNYKVVTFDSQGGGPVKSQYVELGCKAVRPDDPYKTGYKLANWMNGSDDYLFTETVTDNITLKADWTPVEYTIHFDINGGNAGNMGDINATFDADVKLPANLFTKTGYVFKGWSTSADKSGKSFKDGETVSNLTETDGDSITLYAIWDRIAYSVKYDANGGVGEMPNQSFVYDGEQKLTVNTFTRSGYAFAGWSTVKTDIATHDTSTPRTFKDVETVKNLTDKQGDTVVLYAIWSNNVHSVRYDSNGGTKVTDVFVADGNVASKPTDPKKKGYTFIGWMKDDALYDFDEPVKADIALKAKWVANAYKVVFDGNGTDKDTMLEQNMTYNQVSNLTKNAYVKQGYTFAGWNTEKTGTGTDFKDGASVKNLTDEANGSVTLYANWISANYVIKFDANGGVGSMQNQEMTFDVESALNANEFTNSGKGFVGWNKSADGTGDKFIDGATVLNLAHDEGEIVTLYAQWADDGDYKTITFDSNGGSDVLSQNVKTGDLTVKPADPTKAGYAFLGWFDDADSQFEFGKAIDEDITLSAKWEPITYKVTFDSNGGFGVMDDQTFTFDEASTLNKNSFTKQGYTFNAWEAEIDGEVVEYADETEVLNLTDENNAVITFKAVWTANSYVVKFDANEGTGEMEDQTFIYDMEATLNPNEFERAGFVFAGWNTSRSGDGTSYLNGDTVKNVAGEASEVTLYATWISVADAIKVTFDTGDGSEVLPQYVKRGSKLVRPSDPTKLGYTFVGWFNGEDKYDFDVSVTSELILSARWIANTYTVEFGGSNEDDGVMEPMTFTYDVPRKLDKNTYEKENYHFIGWRIGGTDDDVVTHSAGDDLVGNLIADEAEVVNLTPEQNGKVNFEAVWEADVFAIHYYNVEGATNNNPSSYTFGEGVESLQDAYKPGYTFDGWYDNSSLTGDVVTSISTESVGDVSLYAKWTENPSDPVNPLIPSWIKKFIAGTGDSLPLYAGGVLAMLAIACIGIFAGMKKRKQDQA